MSKMTPGERAINWAKAAAIIIPLIGVGAIGNSPQMRQFVGGMFIVNDDGAALVELSPFEYYVQEELERLEGMIEVLKADTTIRINALEAQLAKQDTVNYRSNRKEIDTLKEELIRINGVVQ